jgi:hypothetical protein
MATMLNIAIIAALAATLAALFLGLLSMVKGGAFNARYGNRLMRLRVVVQGLAVALIAAAMLLFALGHAGNG